MQYSQLVNEIIRKVITWYFYRILLSLLLVGNAKPVFVAEEKQIELSPKDVKTWLRAFFEGYDLSKYANATAPCRADGEVLYDFTSAGVQNLFNDNFFIGSLNISDALGQLSPLSRSCYDTTSQISEAFNAYLSRFGGIGDFFSFISLNIKAHFEPIKSKATEALTLYLTTSNYTQIAFLSGQIANLALISEDEYMLNTRFAPLRFTEGDPLAPNPINDVMWIIFEGLYQFGVNSRMASKARLQGCQNSVLNMVLINKQALKAWKENDRKTAWFTFADSMTLAHSIVDDCYHMSSEISTTIKNIRKNGQIGKNLLHNLFFVISGLLGTWSQIYYGDYLNLLGVLGGITYRVFVYGAN